MDAVLRQNMIDVALKKIMGELVGHAEALESIAINVGRVKNAERISVPKKHPGHALSSLPRPARLSPSRRWAVCIIDASVARPDFRGQRTDAPVSALRIAAFSNRCAHMQRCSEFPFISHRSWTSAIYRPAN